MLHQAIEFYAKELDKETKNEWRKIQGRFEEISFIEGPEQSIRVISKALQHNLTKTNIAKIKRFKRASSRNFKFKNFSKHK